MFKKIANKIKLISSAISILVLSACSSVSNLTPHKVVENDNGVYTLTMAAKINDNTVVRGTERPYIVIDGQRHLMKTVLNLRNEVMYQYDYTFPKGKESVSYYYLVDYKARINHGTATENRTIDSGELFVLRPLTKYVMGLKQESAFVGNIVQIQGVGFDISDVVTVGGKEATIASVSRNALSFNVPSLEGNKTYDVEIKNDDNSISWAGSLYVKARDLLVSPSRITRTSGQTVNMIFDIGFNAPEGGFYVDVQTNIPSSVIMPEITIAEGESSVAVPVKFVGAGSGALFVNAEGFKEKIVTIRVNPVESTAVELLNAQDDEISENTLNAPITEEVIEEIPAESPQKEPAKVAPKTEEVVEEIVIIEPKA